MLNLQRKTDQIFRYILSDCIDDTIAKLNRCGEEFLNIFLPHVSEIFSVGETIQLLTNIKRYHLCPGVFSLNYYHYLLIFETLEVYSSSYVEPDENGEVDDVDLIIPGTKIYEIDFDGLIESYFPQELFFIDEKVTHPHQEMLMRKEILIVVRGHKPSIQDLEHRLLQKSDYAFPDKEQVPLFKSNSTKYPDPQLDVPRGKEEFMV
jgi:hypothetical protein